jgi:hypothetical protein
VPAGWSPAALGVLECRRRELSRPSYGAHAGRVGRLVATYTAVGGEEVLPASGLVRLSALRLHVLGYRWGVGARGERRPRTLLATYGARCELPGSGRVVFTCLGVRDVGRGDALSSSPWSVGLAAVLHDFGETSESWSEALRFPRFLFGFRAEELPESWGDAEDPSWRSIGALRAWPQEHFARPSVRLPSSPPRPCSRGDRASWGTDDGRPSRCMLPAAVYADLGPLAGRRQANPALGVLIGHGWLPGRGLGVGPRVRGSVSPSSVPSAHRRADLHTNDEMLSHALTSLASDRGLEASVRRDLSAWCEASRIGLAGGAWGDEATALLCRPLEAVESAGSCALQAIRPPGTAGSSWFGSPFVSADLGDLGPSAGRHDSGSRSSKSVVEGGSV